MCIVCFKWRLSVFNNNGVYLFKKKLISYNLQATFGIFTEKFLLVAYKKKSCSLYRMSRAPLKTVQKCPKLDGFNLLLYTASLGWTCQMSTNTKLHNAHHILTYQGCHCNCYVTTL